jgi:hypothetical protein
MDASPLVVRVTPRPHFTPGKIPPPPPLQLREGWVGLRAGMGKGLENKSFASAGDETSVFQSVVRHYTDWATTVYNTFYVLN